MTRYPASTHDEQAVYDDGLRGFFNATYKHMSAALLITTLFSGVLGHDLLALLSHHGTTWLPPGLVANLFIGPMHFIIMLAPLVLVLILGFAINRIEAGTARALLYVFSALMGVSLATIFVVYTTMSIAQVFLGAAGAFAALSAYGYTTHRDLGPIGRFLFIGLVGLVIVSILNLFVQSGPMQMGLATIGIFIFAGLTAYDTQKLKLSYLAMRDARSDDIDRLAIIGALQLYLDLVNLTLDGLMLFGNRR